MSSNGEDRAYIEAANSIIELSHAERLERFRDLLEGPQGKRFMVMLEHIKPYCSPLDTAATKEYVLAWDIFFLLSLIQKKDQT